MSLSHGLLSGEDDTPRGTIFHGDDSDSGGNRGSIRGGRKLELNKREAVSRLSLGLKWFTLCSLALAYYGGLSRGYMWMTCEPCHPEYCDCCDHNGKNDCHDSSQCYDSQPARHRTGAAGHEDDLKYKCEGHDCTALLCPARPFLDSMAGADAALKPLKCEPDRHVRLDPKSDECAYAYSYMYVGTGSFLLAVLVGAATGELKLCVRRGMEKSSRIAGHAISLGYIAVLLTLPKLAHIMWAQSRWRPHDVAWMVAGIFTAIGSFMSLVEVKKHLENYSIPRLQKHIVRILFMPPIYAIDCFIAMRFNSLGHYLTILREFYEAYCVWSFMALMMDFLGTRRCTRQHSPPKPPFKH